MKNMPDYYVLIRNRKYSKYAYLSLLRMYEHESVLFYNIWIKYHRLVSRTIFIGRNIN